MNIERVHVRAFGRLNDFDTGPEALPGLVVVLGPNEAGKSTLFHFLTTALYGFHPASREGNPYLPWGGEDAGGTILVRLDSDGCAEVERHLRSQPGGKLTADGRAADLKNRALPWVAHVPRQVFRQVFAVTLGELAGLDAETWARVQDRILGSMGASDVRPARVVAEALEQEAGALWRPHRRGKQRIRDMQADIRALRGRRAEALKRDSTIRDRFREQEHTRERLMWAREERQHERVVVDRVHLLAPVRAQLHRITTLREEGGPREALRALPSDPGPRVAELRTRAAQLVARVDELDRDALDPESAIGEFDDGARELLDRSGEIESFVTRTSATATDRTSARALDQDVRDLERRLDAVSTELLAISWADAPRGALAAIPLGELRGRVRDAQRARERRRVAEASAHGAPAGAGPVPLWVGVASALGGALSLAVGGMAGWDWATAPGAAIAAAGATLVVLAVRTRRAGGVPRDAAEDGTTASPMGAELEALVSTERDTYAAVATLLEGVPVSRIRLDEPGEALVGDLERVQSLLHDVGERRRSLDDLTACLDRVDRDATGLAAALDVDQTLEAEALASLLDRELRRAERLRDAAQSADRELRRLRRERDRVAKDGSTTEAELNTLLELLATLGEGSAERGLEVASARQAAHVRADELENELERTHPDLDDLRGRIVGAESSGESWTVDDGDLASRRTRIEQLGEEIESLAASAEALDRDIAHMRDLETADAVDGEIAGLLEEEARLVRERDRRWVLAQLVREADRRFREEHQPDLIRRAGSYLEHLTGGRYDRIIVDETVKGDLFHVMGPGLPRPVPLTPPVSTGTLEQAYLSLRLAIVDHLDQGGERLPLFIDEVFVNWDRERRERGLEVLCSLSHTRQLFVFTCHRQVAEELCRRGARVLELAGDA